MPKVLETATVNAPPERLWPAIEDANRWPEWLTPLRGELEERGPAKITPGTEFRAQIGKIGGARIKIKEVQARRSVAWEAGPGMAFMMHMPMRGRLELTPTATGTQVTITMRTAMMMVPMMKMMAGLKMRDEMRKTVHQLQRLAA